MYHEPLWNDKNQIIKQYRFIYDKQDSDGEKSDQELVVDVNEDAPLNGKSSSPLENGCNSINNGTTGSNNSIDKNVKKEPITSHSPHSHSSNSSTPGKPSQPTKQEPIDSSNITKSNTPILNKPTTPTNGSGNSTPGCQIPNLSSSLPKPPTLSGTKSVPPLGPPYPYPVLHPNAGPDLSAAYSQGLPGSIPVLPPMSPAYPRIPVNI